MEEPLDIGFFISIDTVPRSTLIEGQGNIRWSVNTETGEWHDTVEEWDCVLIAVERTLQDIKGRRIKALRRQAEVRKEISQITGKGGPQ